MKNSAKPIINTHIFFNLFIFALFVFNVNIYSQTPENYKSKLHIEGASNIWGNTISIGYDYTLSKHFYAGVSLGTGYFQYNFGDGNAFFVYSGPFGKDNIASFDFKNLIDLKAGFIFKDRKGLSCLNSLEAGISYIHVIFRDQYVDKYNYLWKGRKSYSLYSLLLNVNIADYKPADENHLSFSFGFKSRLTLTKSPQIVIYENSLGNSHPESLSYDKGNYLLWFYPELYLRINYSL